MFVSDEIVVPLGFNAAQARLANLIHGGMLQDAAHDAYGDGITGRLRVGPSAVVSRLVRAEFRDPVLHGDAAVLTLRWEVAGTGGGLFPVLDADITITPCGEDKTLLRLDGAYRPPLGTVGAGLDRAVLHRVANATMRAFVTRVSDALTLISPERAVPGDQSERAWATAADIP